MNQTNYIGPAVGEVELAGRWLERVCAELPAASTVGEIVAACTLLPLPGASSTMSAKARPMPPPGSTDGGPSGIP